MAKAKKTAAAKKESKSKAEDIVLEYHKKMQASARTHTKDLKANLLDLEPPKGTNGAVRTNVMCVDLITGGGFPRHRMTTVSGDRGAGKTTLIQSSMARQMDLGTRTTYEDLEGAADLQWAKKNGCDMNKYIASKMLDYIPDFNSGDDALRYIHRMQEDAIKAGADQLPFLAGLYFYDSIPAGPPEALTENDEHGSAPLLAIMLSKYLPMIRSKLRKSNSSFVGINQIRENPRQKFGSPEYEPGGNAPDFYADMKLWLRLVGKAKDIALDKDHPLVPKSDSGMFKAQGVNLEENPDGSTDSYIYTHVKTNKNRVFTPLRETYFRVWSADSSGQGQGIDPVFDTIRFYEEIGLCEFRSKKEVLMVNPKSGEVTTHDYYDLKAEILTHPDLREQGYEMLDSGKAFELYFERIKRGGTELAPPDQDEEPGAVLPEALTEALTEAGETLKKDIVKAKKRISTEARG